MTAHVLDRAERIALAAPVLVRSVERIQAETVSLAAAPTLLKLGKGIILSERLKLDEEPSRRLILINHQAFNFNGSRTFDTAARSLAGMVLVIRVARCTTATPAIWPNASTRATLAVSASTDGGTTWQFLAGGASAGGISLSYDTDSGEQAEMIFSCRIPSATNRVRAVVTTTAVLRSELTVEVY